MSTFLVNVARRGAGLPALAAMPRAASATLAVPPGAPAFEAVPERAQPSFGEVDGETKPRPAPYADAHVPVTPQPAVRAASEPEGADAAQPGIVRWRPSLAPRAEPGTPAPEPEPFAQPSAPVAPVVPMTAPVLATAAPPVAPAAAPFAPVAPVVRIADADARAPAHADDDARPAPALPARARSGAPQPPAAEVSHAHAERTTIVHETVRELRTHVHDARVEDRPVPVAVQPAATPALRVHDAKPNAESPASRPPAAREAIVPAPLRPSFALERAPAAASAPARAVRDEAPREVHVTIGTIEIRSPAQAHVPPPQPAAAAREAPAAGFDAYASLRRYERLLP